MKCPWSRTLASVLLLLSPHNVRVLCQNVLPTGTLPQLPQEPCLNAGPVSQQINLPPSNALPTGFVTQRQFNRNYPQLPEYFKHSYPQAYSVPQANIAPIPQGFQIPTANNLPQLQGPINNLANITIPPQQTPLLNRIPFSPISNPSTNSLITTDTFSTQGVSPIAPEPSGPVTPSFNLPQVTNLPFSQVFPPTNIPTTPAVSNVQNQIVSFPQNLTPNIPAVGYQNQVLQGYPLSLNPYSLTAAQIPVNPPSALTADLKSVNILSPPNLTTLAPIQNYEYSPLSQPFSTSVPIQNHVPYLQAPMPAERHVQQSLPVDYSSNTPCLSDHQISSLPPVAPTNPLYDFFGKPIPNTDEYTPVPINLQINVPAPTIPEPQITIITAYPSPPVSPVPVSTESSDVSFGLYPPYPLPPIIIEGKRSRSRTWLPLLLIALIANDGCCCYPCDCACATANVPIPYPIPIPTNNPIIVGKRSRSRKKGSNGKTTITKNSGN